MDELRRSVVATMALALVLAVAAGPVAGAETAGDEALATLSNLGNQMSWVPNGTEGGLALSVSGPETDLAQRFDVGRPAVFSLSDEQGKARPDGSYTWELREELGPVNDRVRDPANGRDAAMHDSDRRVEFSGRVQSGSFTVRSGAVVDSSLIEGRAAGRPTEDGRSDGGIQE